MGGTDWEGLGQTPRLLLCPAGRACHWRSCHPDRGSLWLPHAPSELHQPSGGAHWYRPYLGQDAQLQGGWVKTRGGGGFCSRYLLVWQIMKLQIHNSLNIWNLNVVSNLTYKLVEKGELFLFTSLVLVNSFPAIFLKLFLSSGFWWVHHVEEATWKLTMLSMSLWACGLGMLILSWMCEMCRVTGKRYLNGYLWF